MLSAGMPFLWLTLIVTCWASSASGMDTVISGTASYSVALW